LAEDGGQRQGAVRMRDILNGSVSKVEMTIPMALIFKELFPSISTFETPPTSSMEPTGYAASNDRNEPAHCVASASGTPAAYAKAPHTETPRARSGQCPDKYAVRGSQGSIVFARS